MRDPAPPLEALLVNAAFVRGVARAVLGADDRVDDVVQETWMIALRSGPRRPASLRAWLASIARRRAWHVQREDAARVRWERHAPEAMQHVAVERITEEEETRRVLVDAVLALEEPYRSTLLLRYYQGLSIKQTAEVLQVPVETVRTRQRRGLEHVRHRLDAEHGGKRGGSVALLAPLAAPSALAPATIAGVGGIVVMKLAVVGVVLLAIAAAVLVPRWIDEEGVPTGKDPATELAAEPPVLEGRPVANAAPPESDEPSPPPVDLTQVDRDRDLHGLVVRPDGTPVAGALLQIIAYPWRYSGMLVQDGHRRETPGPSTTSATDGSFAIRLALGDQVHLRMSAAGLATTEYAMLQAGEYLRAVLHEAVKLRVEATAPDGRPASSLQMRVSVGSRGGINLNREGETDASGIAVFEDLPPGQAALLFPAPRVDTWGYPGAISISLPQAGEMTYDLTLPEGRLLTGRVTDVETGEPIEGARIGMGHSMRPDAHTDESGQYALPGWMGRQGSDGVDVLAPGYARAQTVVGEKEVLDFALQRGFSVKGRLLGQGGEPVAGALLNSVGSRHDGVFSQSLSMADGISGADGTFHLQALRSDLPHNITIHARGYARWMQDLGAPPESGVIDLGDLRLKPARTLLGLVVGSQGEPLARILLDLKHFDPDLPPRHRYGRSWDRLSDDLGRFRFADLPPGRYKLLALAPGKPRASQDVTINDTDAPTELTLTMDTTGREVRLQVVDNAGMPIPRLYVTAQPKREGRYDRVRVRVDREGQAVMLLPAEVMTLSVIIAPDLAFLQPASVEIGAEATEARIVLEKAAVTTGQVLAPDGTPVPSAQVEIRSGKHRPVTVYADGKGRFEYKAAPGSVFDLVFTGSARVSMGGGALTVGALPLQQGVAEAVHAGATDVLLRSTGPVVKGRTLTVRVLDPEGQPVPKVSVLLDPPLPIRASRLTGDDGSLKLEGLRALETKVSLFFGSTLEQPWRVPPPQTFMPEGQTVELRLVVGARIEGRLLDEGGLPVPVADVMVYVGGKFFSMARVGSEGRFVVVVDPDEKRLIKLLAWLRGAEGQVVKQAEAENLRPGATNVVLQFKKLK